MEIKKVMVVGAGTMGSGIAQVCLTAGLNVVICDTFAPQLDRAKAGIEKGLGKLVAKEKMTEAEKAACLTRTSYTTDMADGADADLVIEAVLEKLEVKQDVFRKLSDLVREDAILASNTSTISISSIGSVIKNPERFLGTHFFNPVPVMKLLEIIRGLRTSGETIETIKAFGKKLGKVCIVSKDSAGFIANRIGSPMLNAAANAYDLGIGSREDIDAAMQFGWSHPMGPLALIDLVGVDVQVAVMEVLYAEYGDPYYKPAPILKRMMAAGMLGRKSGKGFYDYTK